MSRFNNLYIGEPEVAVEELERTDMNTTLPTQEELRLALINALNRIAELERQFRSLTGDGR